MKYIVIVISLAFSSVASASEPVYNFNFYNGSKEKPSDINSKTPKVTSESNSIRDKKEHGLSSAYLGLGQYLGETLSSSTLEAGIYKQKSENLFIQYAINYERRYIDYWVRSNSAENDGAEGGSYGIELLSGIYHGSDIRKNSFFGIFHELNYGIGFYRGRYAVSEMFYCNQIGQDSCSDGVPTSELEDTFSSITYTASYKAGIKLNLALFWLAAGYEVKYLNNFVGEDLPEYAYDEFEQRVNVKIELPL